MIATAATVLFNCETAAAALSRTLWTVDRADEEKTTMAMTAGRRRNVEAFRNVHLGVARRDRCAGHGRLMAGG